MVEDGRGRCSCKWWRMVEVSVDVKDGRRW